MVLSKEIVGSAYHLPEKADDQHRKPYQSPDEIDNHRKPSTSNGFNRVGSLFQNGTLKRRFGAVAPGSLDRSGKPLVRLAYAVICHFFLSGIDESYAAAYF